MNRIIRLNSLQGVLDYWPFFREGLEALRDPQKANLNDTEEEFFRILMHCVSKPASETLCLVVVSKKGYPLAFGVSFAVMPFWKNEKFLWLYAAYSNGKNDRAVQDMYEYCMKWSRENKFKEVQTCTGRVTGAALKWFRKKGFRLKHYSFSQGVL
ncbi:MAG: hypothetical protein K1X66_02335 [Verrucomicrobiae bacterium]|nr:hypothetical protein [Verrucomicrobiae bacterium]